MSETLGIDIGTSGVRAVLADATGAERARGEAAIAAERRRDPAAIADALEAALGALRARVALGGVAALAVDGTSGTLFAVDGAGRPMSAALLYNDRAEAAIVARIGAVAPPESAAHGATSALARAIGVQESPGAARILHEADWVGGLFSGCFDVSDANNALKTGYDPVAGAWPGWLAEVGARTALLPRVVAPGRPVGEVTAAAAARFGLPRGALVAAGTTDGCASFLATGAGAVGDGVSALGSTLVLKLLSDRPIFAPAYGVYSHLILGMWLAGGASNTGGRVLDAFFSRAELVALSAGIDPERESPCDFVPLLVPGERFPVNDPALAPRLEPRPAAAGAFLHGLLESIAAVEAEGYRRLAALGGPPVARVLSVGGGAANAAWTAIRARRLGVTVSRAASSEAALGTARLARAALAG